MISSDERSRFETALLSVEPPGYRQQRERQTLEMMELELHEWAGEIRTDDKVRLGRMRDAVQDEDERFVDIVASRGAQGFTRERLFEVAGVLAAEDLNAARLEAVEHPPHANSTRLRYLEARRARWATKLAHLTEEPAADIEARFAREAGGTAQ